MSGEQYFAAASVVVSLLALGFSTRTAHSPKQATRTRTQRIGDYRRDRPSHRPRDRRRRSRISRASTALLTTMPSARLEVRRRPGARYSSRSTSRRSLASHAVACSTHRSWSMPSGFMLRSRWNTIRPFVERLRRVRDNAYLFENFRVAGNLQRLVEGRAAAARRPQLRSGAICRRAVQSVRCYRTEVSS